jgi:hypothetical protein
MDYDVSYCPLNGAVGYVFVYFEMWNYQNVNIASRSSPLQVVNCLDINETYTYTYLLDLRELTYNTGYSFDTIKDDILNYGEQYVRFATSYIFQAYSSMYGYTMNVSNVTLKTFLQINFNNYYLMSTFLLETDHSTSNRTGVNRPFVLYTATEENIYNVYNNETSNVSNRTKYAVTIPEIDAAISVKYIGTGFETKFNNYSIVMGSSAVQTYHLWILYLLNAAPMATPFDDVAIDTTPNYSVCNYVLGFPVDCTIDGVAVGSFQAMANDLWEWTIKESPIFSDVWTLASGGFQWLSNTFQFLGYFDVDSLLGGVLALLIGVLVMLWAWIGG